MDDRTKELEARIVELERKLETLTGRQPVDISAEEMRAYQKVRDAIAADFGGFCGINDCFRCFPLRCGGPGGVLRCHRCITECTCGPCGGGLGGGGGGFGGFGL